MSTTSILDGYRASLTGRRQAGDDLRRDLAQLADEIVCAVTGDRPDNRIGEPASDAEIEHLAHRLAVLARVRADHAHIATRPTARTCSEIWAELQVAPLVPPPRTTSAAHLRSLRRRPSRRRRARRLDRRRRRRRPTCPHHRPPRGAPHQMITTYTSAQLDAIELLHLSPPRPRGERPLRSDPSGSPVWVRIDGKPYVVVVPEGLLAAYVEYDRTPQPIARTGLPGNWTTIREHPDDVDARVSTRDREFLADLLTRPAYPLADYERYHRPRTLAEVTAAAVST